MTDLQKIEGEEKHGGKYLTFLLSQENYGIHILKVQEIIGVMHTTRVPAAPSYMKGVINLRGKIIPVIDLRLKFGIAEREYDEKTCTIVVDIDISGKKIPVGIIVDTVVEVANFSDVMVEPSPNYGSRINTSFVSGMARASESNSVVILLDVEKVLEDIPALQAIGLGTGN